MVQDYKCIFGIEHSSLVICLNNCTFPFTWVTSTVWLHVSRVFFVCQDMLCIFSFKFRNLYFWFVNSLILIVIICNIILGLIICLAYNSNISWHVSVCVLSLYGACTYTFALFYLCRNIKCVYCIYIKY